MAFMEWQKSFELNIEEFDDHHKHLIGLIDCLFDSYRMGKDKEILGGMLYELVSYTEYHFQAEEAWMTEHKYPSLSQHHNEHINFVSKVIEFNNDFKDGKAELSADVLKFLVNWLTQHILKADASYGKFAGTISSYAYNYNQ